jgi:hypothetical protein
MLAKFSSYAVIIGELLRIVERDPQLDLPVSRLPVLPVSDLDGVDQAALSVRRDVVPDPASIPNVVALAESLGVLVVFGPPEIAAIDAFSVWIDGRPMIVLNPEHPPSRLRFDVAHEIGHLVMHQDEQAALVGTRNERENQAHHFARVLLAPHTSEFDSRLGRAVRTYGWRALGALQSQVGLPLRELLTFAKEQDSRLESIAGKRATEANASPASAAEFFREGPSEQVTLVPDLLELAAFNSLGTILSLAEGAGVPLRYAKLALSRQPPSGGTDPHA